MAKKQRGGKDARSSPRLQLEEGGLKVGQTL